MIIFYFNVKEVKTFSKNGLIQNVYNIIIGNYEMVEQKHALKDIEYPDFKKIIKHCKSNMKEKYPEYGNSWNNQVTISWEWWEKRLKNEIDEIKQCGYDYDKMSEIADAISILTMMYEKANFQYELEQSTRMQR